MFLGVDQSLSNTGLFFLERINNPNYCIEIKNVLIYLNTLITELNNKPQEYKNILEKSATKTFSFKEQITKSIKYNDKQKERILNSYESLLNEQNKITLNIDNKIIQELFIYLTNKNNENFDLNKIFKFNMNLLNPKNLNGTERLYEFQLLYSNIIKNNLDKICCIAMEGYSYGSSATRSVFELGELAGQIKLVNYIEKIDTIIVPPSSLKKAIVGKGNANKDDVKAFFVNKFNIKFSSKKDDDLYDALALALFIVLLPYFDLITLLKIKFI